MSSEALHPEFEPEIGPEIVSEKSFSNRIKFEKLFLAKESDNQELAAKIREEIIEFNKPLAHAVASRFSATKKIGLKDVTSEAYLGLIHAVDHYNDFNFAFSSYAYPCIWGYCSNFRRTTESVKDNVGNSQEIFDTSRQAVIDRLKKINEAIEGYEPSEDEILHNLAVIYDRRLSLYEKISSRPFPLEQKKIFYDSEQGNMAELEKDIVDNAPRSNPAKAVENLALAEGIEQVLSIFPLRWQIVIAARFGLLDLLDKLIESSGDDELRAKYAELTDESVQGVSVSSLGSQSSPDRHYSLQEIADLLGVTKERIRQIEEKTLEKMSYPENNKPLAGYNES